MLPDHFLRVANIGLIGGAKHNSYQILFALEVGKLNARSEPPPDSGDCLYALDTRTSCREGSLGERLNRGFPVPGSRT
jgi:hypothetical protein